MSATVTPVPGTRQAAPPASAPRWHAVLRALVARGLRDQRRSVLTWGISLGLLGAFEAAIYGSVQDSIGQAIENYPEGLKKAFGISDMSTIEGYLHAELFSLIVPLAIGFFAIRSVLKPLVIAEERGQLDTILSLPVRRGVLVGAAVLVTALLTLAVLGVFGAMTWAASAIGGTGLGVRAALDGVIGSWPLAMAFAGLAVCVAGRLHRPGTVTGIAGGTLVAMYAFDVAGRLTDTLVPLRWLSLFRAYGRPLLDGLDPLGMAVPVVIGVMLVVLGAALFERRDVHH